MPRILITRSLHQSSELADRLRALGADTILIPTIDIAEPSSFAPLDAALGHLDDFHWLIFTSANAVEAFHRRCGSVPGHTLFGAKAFPRTASIGPATSRALGAMGVEPALMPAQAVAESLSESLLPFARCPDGAPTRFLLIRAESGGDSPPRDVLPETLRSAGAEVTIAAAYRTVIPAASITAIRELFGEPAAMPDAITFTSSSTAKNLFTLLKAAGLETAISTEGKEALIPPQRPLLASIGPITSATLRELGHPPHVEAIEATVTSLAESLVEYLAMWKIG